MGSPLLLSATSFLQAISRASGNGTYGMTEGISNVSSSACPTEQGAHIIVARGSYEPAGYGIIGAVKDSILDAIPGSTAQSVDYPAVIQPNYIESESDGVIAMRQLIADFVGNCSGSPLVLMGYSQGAQITTDSLAGQNTAGFPLNTTINEPPPARTLERVAAAIVMGDPSHLINQTFSVGNADKDGIFPQRNQSNFETTGLASRIQSYCDAGDPYCAAGGNLTVHLLYVQEYGKQAVDFVVSQVSDWYANSTNTTTDTPSSATTPTPTPTGSTGSALGTRVCDTFGVLSIALLGSILAFAL